MQDNVTRINHFVLTGFPGLPAQYWAPVSVLLLILFLTIAVGNIFILVLVCCERSLHKPTYLIFCQLALSDLGFAIVTLPRVIYQYWFDDSAVGFTACFVQMFFVHFLSATHSFILMAMGLDRFVAICAPLRYSGFTNTVASSVCGVSWCLAWAWMVFIVNSAYSLSYSGSNTIIQCYCDYNSINLLADFRPPLLATLTFAGAMFFLLTPLAFLIFSYFAIIFIVLRISSQEGRRRTFSTCIPQLIITLLYYLPRCFVYLSNFLGFTFSYPVRIVIIMLYSLLPAAINPLIYCFKTKEIKECWSQRNKRTKVHIGLGEK